jgi:hypothetical protein
MGRRHLLGVVSLRRFGAALLLAPLATGMVAARDAPSLLQITIETIKPGRLAQYDAVELRLAEMCERRKCPNSYLALESTTAPTAVWWLVEYASQLEVDRVAKAYQDDAALLRDLTELSAQKQEFTDEPVSRMTTRRADLGDSAAWRIGEVPFAVIAEQRGAAPRVGAVFDSADGARLVVVGAATRTEADTAAAMLGEGARVFRVHPSWSMPAAAWVAANPELWARR